jgi:glycosyltransferase involved in cell wall biosynthesis
MIDAMRALGVDEAKIELVFFGIDVERFTPGPSDDEILTRWGAVGRPVVISLRNLEPIYDIGTLLKSIPAVVKSFPDVLLVVCGYGSEADNLKRLASGLGIDRNVHFTGRYANAELPRMLRSADAYVSTSLSDAGIAASTAEAMACGIPVVVTNTGENDKWIDEGHTGFVVKARDDAALAERLIAILGDKEAGRRIGAAGRQVIAERNSYQREMEKMEQHYRTLAASAAR